MEGEALRLKEAFSITLSHRWLSVRSRQTSQGVGEPATIETVSNTGPQFHGLDGPVWPDGEALVDRFGLMVKPLWTGQFGLRVKPLWTGHFGLMGKPWWTGQFGLRVKPLRTGQFGLRVKPLWTGQFGLRVKPLWTGHFGLRG